MNKVAAIACFAGGAVVASFFFARTAKAQLLAFTELKEHGATATGKILSVKNGATQRLTYEFASATGEAKQYVYVTHSKDVKTFAEGESVEVLYAPEAPSIHTITALFDDKLVQMQEQSDRLSSLPWQSTIVFSLTLWWLWISLHS